MTPQTPTVTARDAHVAMLMLDTRVGGRHIPRATFRKVTPPGPAAARRVAARLQEAVGETIIADDIIGAHRALRSAIPTHDLRAIAAAA